MLKTIKQKPILNSIRHTCKINKSFLWKGKSLKNLSFFIKKTKFKNSLGRKILRTRIRRLKRRYRLLEYKRSFFGIPGEVIRLEYNPYITSFIALVLYKNGILCYINTSKGFFKGAVISSYLRVSSDLKKSVLFTLGNTLILNIIAPGSTISNVEHYPNLGPIYCKSAGTFSQLLRKDRYYGYIKLPTGKIKKLSLFVKASLGSNLNSSNKAVVLGKAGKSHWLGFNPIVRGVAGNPIDHPHGGGEGKKSKKADPRTYWGKVYKWRKTRKHF